MCAIMTNLMSVNNAKIVIGKGLLSFLSLVQSWMFPPKPNKSLAAHREMGDLCQSGGEGGRTDHNPLFPIKGGLMHHQIKPISGVDDRERRPSHDDVYTESDL